LIQNFEDVAPTVEQIEALFAAARRDPSIMFVEIVIHPDNGGVILRDILEPFSLKVVGSVSFAVSTFMRWQSRVSAPSLTQDEQKIAFMRAGIEGMAAQ
jgi:hypothetical protein